MRLDKLGEDIPVQFVGGEGAPDEKASTVTYDVGEKLHVEKILKQPNKAKEKFYTDKWLFLIF